MYLTLRFFIIHAISVYCASLLLAVDADDPGRSMRDGEVEASQLLWFEDFDSANSLQRFTGNAGDYEATGGENGSGCLTVTATEPGVDVVVCSLNPELLRGKTVVLDGQLRAKNLRQYHDQAHMGPKLTIYFRSASGGEQWHDQPKEYGDYDWTGFRNEVKIPNDVEAVKVLLGLQMATGNLSFDNLKIYEKPRLRSATPRPSESELEAVRVDGLCATPRLKLSGEWAFNAIVDTINDGVCDESFNVSPLAKVKVFNEELSSVQIFKASGPGWDKGNRLKGIYMTPDALEVDSVVVRNQHGVGMELGRDYLVDPRWGTIGRVEGGSIGADEPVYVDYSFYPQRIDSVFLKNGQLYYREGKPLVTQARPPEAESGEVRVANIFLSGRQELLTEGNFYPILETSYPIRPNPVADELLPETMKKLRDGGTLRVLAWGDSITDGGYLREEGEGARWQRQFVEKLQRRFPQAKIVLVTEAWGGRNTNDYFGVPAGHPHNYREKVIAPKPDLVISEFINDSWHSQENFERNYGQILTDLNAIGAEWIVIAPSYQRGWGMEDATGQKNIDDDPRAYIAMLRNFSSAHRIPCADVSARYGRLWRQGIPFLTLMTNQINHPNRTGLEIYADALMALFPES
ncbi:SGNH/GDSL hydrolase family protein [Ruficoccus amylovorans]|uniref:SGNH/GDSL hydrolase family protein n=1 Tax=Ruficoccus amylovorans TaxID=1804625 RepID=A0A842HE02_9BACT|nr:SGNH/GDSL hydrolase family protein [Ruficoccus amylovorans]MBC2593807.1 SGNH/GDSL hydrolase family protein [Ruficoccus amylovorans]